MRHTGSCHCGDTRFEVEGSFDTVIECNCSHCSRKGYLLWFVPRSALHVQASTLATYTFNRHAIRHQFCPRCGCAPFGLGEQNGEAMAAINVRCLEGVALDGLKRQHVDGRSF